jgi:hypothetical protein
MGGFRFYQAQESRDWELIVVAPLSRERLTGHAIWPKKHLSGYATNQELAPLEPTLFLKAGQSIG